MNYKQKPHCNGKSKQCGLFLFVPKIVFNKPDGDSYII